MARTMNSSVEEVAPLQLTLIEFLQVDYLEPSKLHAKPSYVELCSHSITLSKTSDRVLLGKGAQILWRAKSREQSLELESNAWPDYVGSLQLSPEGLSLDIIENAELFVTSVIGGYLSLDVSDGLPLRSGNTIKYRNAALQISFPGSSSRALAALASSSTESQPSKINDGDGRLFKDNVFAEDLHSKYIEMEFGPVEQNSWFADNSFLLNVQVMILSFLLLFMILGVVWLGEAVIQNSTSKEL